MGSWIAGHWSQVFTLIGMALTIFGAIRAAIILSQTPQEAGERAVARFAPNDPNDWAHLPAAKRTLSESAAALDGMGLIAVGTVIQSIPVIISLFVPG